MRRSLLALTVLAVACVCVHQAHATCSIASRPDNDKAFEHVLSNAEKAAIVERHDWYKIHTPEAVDDMMLYQWDNGLEATARVWAKKCFWGHSENSCRTNVANFSNTGENLASGYGSPYEPTASPSGMVKMVENWAGERAYYHWVGNTCDGGKVCGHYTQMVWHDANHIGCAMMNCPTGTIFPSAPAWYLVCHYGKAGNWYGQAPGHIAVGNPCAEGRRANGASRCGDYGVCVMSGGNYHCECEAGYYSPSNIEECVVDNRTNTGGSPNPGGAGADLCHPASGVDPCSGHGVCVADALTLEGYRCICSAGWSGVHCETALNPCTPNPCAYGTCSVNSTGTYTCTCQSGWTGLQCDVPADPCKNPTNPCKNGGTCKANGASYTCTCATGYTGTTCTTAVSTGTTPSDVFMKRLLALINQDRAALNLTAVSWITNLADTALAGTTSCPLTNRALASGQSESLTRVCNYAANALPETFADQMINFWRYNNAWWTPSAIRRIGCAFKQGNACNNTVCSGVPVWKPLDCIYATGTAEAEEDFMVSWGHPMLHGRAEMEALEITFEEERHSEGHSVYVYAAIAAAGVVVAAVGLVVAARRRRAAAGQPVEYVELMAVEDQMA